MPESVSSIIAATTLCSVQAIHAGSASTIHSTGLLLIGDAARIGIPHIGAGTSKAIEDARTLANAIDFDRWWDRLIGTRSVYFDKKNLDFK